MAGQSRSGPLSLDPEFEIIGVWDDDLADEEGRSFLFEEEDDEDRALTGNALKHYWTKGPGLLKWKNSPHPWTTLKNHLVKYVGAERAKRIAAQWFKVVFGIWPGERKGKNPKGPG